MTLHCHFSETQNQNQRKGILTLLLPDCLAAWKAFHSGGKVCYDIPNSPYQDYPIQGESLKFFFLLFS